MVFENAPQCQLSIYRSWIGSLLTLEHPFHSTNFPETKKRQPALSEQREKLRLEQQVIASAFFCANVTGIYLSVLKKWLI